MAQCEFRRSDGVQCRAHARRGQKFCRLHADPDSARELGRKGGQSPREKAVLSSADFSLKSPQEVAAMLEHVLNSMLKGELDRGLASCAGYLGQGIIKALEVGDLAERVRLLEERLPKGDKP